MTSELYDATFLLLFPITVEYWKQQNNTFTNNFIPTDYVLGLYVCISAILRGLRKICEQDISYDFSWISMKREILLFDPVPAPESWSPPTQKNETARPHRWRI